MKRGWAPLAPALQPALDAAMSSTAERVEVLVDPVARSWVPDPAAAGEAIRQRCVVYVALPLEQKMGKVGGEPPRPVRWRASDEDDDAVAAAAGVVAAASGADTAPTCEEPAVASEAREGPSTDKLPSAEAWTSAGCPPAPEEEPGAGEPPGADVELQAETSPGTAGALEEDDPLTFTAKPSDGVVIQSAVFERLQHGVSARYAGHRYGGKVLAS